MPAAFLVADFNREWPDVKRTRETLVLAQELGRRRANLNARFSFGSSRHGETCLCITGTMIQEDNVHGTP